MPNDESSAPTPSPVTAAAERKSIRLFVCGDVMTGRGIDQILPHPCDPALHESHVGSALDYVRLAEDVNGPIPRPQGLSYVWGVALGELDRARPDARIVNLETSITRSDDYVPKGINYRMSPENAGCLAAAGIDCCVLANNHVLDWGRAGLLDTLQTLDRLRIRRAGAGRDDAEASAPAIVDIAGKGRVVVFAFAATTSGVPLRWAATRDQPGVNLLTDLSDATLAQVVEGISRARRPGDVTIASIHWGPNWGYEVPAAQARFARALVDRAGVAIVHGHSSHHPKPIEVHRNRLILHGCGDFLNDYEGIGGYEAFRGDLPLMFFADVDPATGELVALELVPLQIRRFQLVHAVRADQDWLLRRLNEVSQRYGTRLEPGPDGRFFLGR
jgi:poly-gamma-glutamate synthesis protein (capsule biosynthesis protein)